MNAMDTESITDEFEKLKAKIADLQARVADLLEPAETDADVMKAKKALLASEERLLTIFDHTPVGICITNEKGIFELANRAYCQLYRYEPEELIGQHFTIVVPEEYKAQLSRLHDMFIDGFNEMRGEWEVRRSDGSRISILADAAAITGRDGRPKKVTFVMDITERKNAEKLQADIERMTRHDLKSPLAGIIGIPGLMKNDPNLTEDQKSKLELIEMAGKKMLKMINMSLSMYRMETGTYEYSPARLDLVSLIRSIFSEMFQLTAEKQIRNWIDINGIPVSEDQTYYINGEELLLYSMFSNLISNAVEASPRNDAVTVSVRADSHKESHIIEIHNQGAVPADIKDRFFEKYTTSGKKGGTGLGTYSARLIALTHKGDIVMRSDSKAGTSVFVTLPF